MGYSLNPVKEDIKRLSFLFRSLSSTFRVRKIDDELQTKSVELGELFTKLAVMVDSFDDKEKQDEGGALDDEEKQHERSVLEVKKHERIVLELWLEELQEAVFNTEDLVDKIHTEAWRHKLDGQVSEKMEDIRRCIESHVKEGDVLGLAGSTSRLLQEYNELMEENMHNDPFEQPWKRQRRPLEPTDYNYFVDESEVFGMDCDKEEIIKLLLSDDANDKQLSVISIVGKGRIGKTTLARLVYNEQRVSHHFDRKAWVDVTDDCAPRVDVTDVFAPPVNVPDDFNWVTWSILKFLTSQYEDLREKYNILHQLELDQLRLELQNCLKGKRFLLVLDFAKQIPSFKGWEALQSAFNFAANGSHIIVTTRNEVIAPMKYAVRSHRMEPLSEEKCWTIFAKFAFGDQNPTSDRQLEVIGKEIVQMCHGLPSSARILGSLLRFKLQQEEWEAILKRLKPSSDSKENVDVVPNFRLPEYVTRCLAYCSIFPPDYEFETVKLVLLCMAEGFQEPDLRETVKCASDSFIEKLKPFLQKSSRNESSFRMCRNNLADCVSTRYCFRLEDNHPSQIPLNTRYLSLVGGKYENSVIFEAIDRVKLLRTFLALDHESRHLCATELQNLLSKLQFLRVLSLSHYHITEIPDSIGNLEHLRYIDLSHTAITRLPESVCELYNLQSLILSNCHSLTELPENTSNLKNLFYLDVSGSSLTELPKNTSSLFDLLYLDVSGSCLSGMPNRMSKLKKLKSLSSFVVSKSGSPLRELRNIELEGTLHISKLQNVASGDDARGAGLLEKCLHELVLEWDEDAADPKNATEVLDGLRPHKSLAKLTINFYNGTNVASWFEFWRFDHLFFLRLSNCKNCSTLPSLRKLPSIRVLIIECMDAVEEVGPDFSGKTSPRKEIEFKSLERLTFEGMSKWTKWVPLDVLPCLKQLCIRRCPKLRGSLPKLLPSVERVEISESQELVTALTTEESLKNLRYRDRIVSISSDGEETYFKSECATGSSSLIIKGVDIEELKETEGSEETDMEILEEISSLPPHQHTAECSLPVITPGEVTEKLEETQKGGETKEETNVEIQTTSQTKWSKQERKEYIEDPSQFPFSEVQSTLPLPQRRAAGEVSSSPVVKKSKEISETEERGECEDETDADIETTLKAKVITPEQDESNEEYPSPSLFSEEKSSLPMSQTPNSRNEADVLTDPWSNQDGVQDLSFESMKVSEISKLMDLLTRVHSLKIEGCDDLEFIPQRVMSSELSLQDLYIINCCSLKSFPKDHPPTALKILYIRNCKKLNFPLTTEKKTHQDALLEYLCIGSSCDSLKSISLDLFPNLKSLSIWDCANLELLSMPVQKNLTSLEALEIRDCHNLVSFLGGGLHTMNLTSVWLSNCKKLKELPELHTLDSLQSLFINNCPELVSLSENGLPSRLSLLSITFCNKLKLKDEWGLDGLDYLRRLEIEGGCVDVRSFPEKFLPSNLSSLRISRLSNLENLDKKDFQKLTALQRLEISSCHNLRSLPENGFPSSLSFLCIKECPLLTSKFRNKKGKDWSKIDHISCIEIDEEVIS